MSYGYFSKYDREVVRVFQIREHHAQIVKLGRYVMAGLIVPTTNKECQGVYEFCLFIHCFLVDLSLTLYVKVLCLLSLLLFLNCLNGHQGLLIEKSLHHLDAAGVKGSHLNFQSRSLQLLLFQK